MWKCATCDREFEIIPDDAVRLTHTAARTNVYRFSDGAIHSLRKIRSPKSESVLPPLESPREATELLQSVVEVLTELPQSQSEPIKREATEPEIEPMTTMAAAFRNFKS